MRAGGKTLTQLGNPRIFLILRSLAGGPKSQLELRRDAGAPAQSTLRGHCRALEAAGAIERHRRNSFPGTLEYALTERGRELIVVAASLQVWLDTAPNGPVELGGDLARAAIKGLADSWSVTVLTTLAAGPLSLTELDKQIAAVSYPTIERCLETMRIAEQLDVGERTSRGTPYTIREWLRRGLTPLILAARWEHRHETDEVDAIDQTDIEDAIRLGGPLIELPKGLNGLCQFAVRIPGGEKQGRTFGFLRVSDGQMTFAAANPPTEPDALASGTMDTWFASLIDADTTGLRMSGDHELAGAILGGIHEALFKGLALIPK